MYKTEGEKKYGFIIMGIMRGGKQIVLQKAINICLECSCHNSIASPYNLCYFSIRLYLDSIVFQGNK